MVLLEDEQMLVERLQSGDTSALEGLWHAYSGVLYSQVIFPKLLNRAQSEDVVQNTFLKAFERIGSFKWQSHGILPWLKTIARNLTMDIYRRRRGRQRLGEGLGQHMDVMAGGLQESQRPDKALESRSRQNTLGVRVRAVLEGGRLNSRYRQAIEMRVFRELTRQECAAELGVRVETFDVLFHRALKRFEMLYQQVQEESEHE